MNTTEIVVKVISILSEYGLTSTTLISTAVAYVSFLRKDIALVIANADKDNDGTLTNIELEDLAVYYIKKSPNPYIKLIPEFVLRYIISGLCLRRKLLIRVSYPESFVMTSNAQDEEGD
jgi:hypothetical protein